MTETIHTNSKTGFFALLGQAFRGDIKEFTTGSIDRAIFLLAVPMVLEMVLESTFALVDIFFVNKVSSRASATVVLTEASLTILYSVAWGLAMGITALVARRAGEKDFKQASRLAGQGIVTGILFSLMISFVGFFFPKEILGFMGASDAIVKENYQFTQIMLTGNMVIMLLFINNAIFRGVGDASLAMRTLMIANGINILLDPLLILGWGPIPKMGVNGAAIATTIGRGFGVLYQLFHLFKGKDLIRLTLLDLKPVWGKIGTILKTSFGGMFQFIIGSCSWIFLVKIISQTGATAALKESATSGYGTAIRICIFTILPAWGMANAAATLVGQNLGAGQPLRAEKSVWRTAFLTMCFFVLITFLFFFFGENLMKLFTSDPVAIQQGTLCLHILAIGYIFFAYGMVLCQAFNGAGDTMTPTILNLFIYWVIQIPLAWWLATHLLWGPKGVYIAIGAAEALLAVAGIIIFKMGRWKKVKL